MSGGATPAFLVERPTQVLRTDPLWSIYGVWYRHARVYCRSLLANATPPVLEPVFFFTAMAIGLARYLTTDRFDGLPYNAFIASGIVVSSSMFTGVFETTYGTFVRLTWQRTYDAMLATHLRPSEVFTGELVFCGTKGFAFATVVMLVTALFGVQLNAWCLLVPCVGFITAYLFGGIGLIVTSFVRMIQNFTFFTTGVITPLFFFSGTFFPVKGTGVWAVECLWFALPLSHSVELSRALYKADFTPMTLAHLGMLLTYAIAAHVIGVRCMRGRLLG